MYFCTRWPSRSSDRQRLLGVVLPGAWNSAWWPNAERQDYRRRRRFLQHVFQRDWSRKTRSSRRVRWFRANSCRWVDKQIPALLNYKQKKTVLGMVRFLARFIRLMNFLVIKSIRFETGCHVASQLSRRLTVQWCFYLYKLKKLYWHYLHFEDRFQPTKWHFLLILLHIV